MSVLAKITTSASEDEGSITVVVVIVSRSAASEWEKKQKSWAPFSIPSESETRGELPH